MLTFVSLPLPHWHTHHRLSAKPVKSLPKPKVLLPNLTQPRRLTNLVAMAQQAVSSEKHGPVVQQKKFLIPNKNGHMLAGVLHDVGSGRLAVLCHGFRSNKEQETLLNLANSLTREGISAFRFDFSGNGESEGSFQYGGYWKEVDDLRDVVLHLSQAKQEVCAIVGHSKGGDVVLLYASKYHDISTVVNVSGRFDLKKGIEERLGKDFMERVQKDGFIDVRNSKGDVILYHVTLESLMDRLNTDVFAASKSINHNCRVLTVHGSKDEIIPVEDALEFDKLIPNHKLVIVEQANHCYTAHQSELASIVVDFIKDSCQPKKPSSEQVMAANVQVED
ncbi:hypothetical protein EJ110_NYTH09668 [Nymphaea thermarum]|nr:hypothetical protein EJ110_NYTH09668 [Nymphaea thermarum]